MSLADDVPRRRCPSPTMSLADDVPRRRCPSPTMSLADDVPRRRCPSPTMSLADDVPGHRPVRRGAVAAGVLVSGGAGLLAVLEGRLTGWRAPEAPAAISTPR